MIALVLLAVLGLAAQAHANEGACTTLGSNCICSEPMNNASFSQVAGASWAWNASDTSTLQCRTSGQDGGIVENDGSPLSLVRETAASNSTMFNALPAGHSLTYVWRSPSGDGTGAIGTKFISGTHPTARRGVRFYRYYSSDHRFTDGVAPNCNSGKVFQAGWNGAYTGGPMYVAVSGGWSVYDISTSLQWSSTVEFSRPFPGGTSSLPGESDLKGKWIRYEVYVNNTGTSGTSSFEWYMKNVTDNLPEVTLMNTSGYAPMSGVHPTSELTDFNINGFRRDNGDPCDGYIAHSHFLAAAWSSNSGQRIGAATEIEGGGGGSSNGSNPTGGKGMSPRINLRRGS